MAEKIISRPLLDEMKTSYLNYAMSVIVSRALPDVKDGLKPVQRRILYAMHKLGILNSRPHKKCATIVGEVLGKYHPHGDQAIYDSLVRMAQDFSLRYPLIDGQGNFGSIDGHNAAAMRYTECRMDAISNEMLLDIQKETVDFQNNFDDSLQEPIVMPSATPNLLINGVSGIAVGMATNIPSHNLKEVIEAVNHYIDNRECSIEDLLEYVNGPDFPTGGLVYCQNLTDAYKTGRGGIKIRGKVDIVEFKENREAIIITEIPYQVNKAEMIKKIAFAVKEERIKGISDLRDESDREGIRVVVELKSGTNAQTTLNQIYKHSTLEVGFGFNWIALVDKSPKLLNLKQVIEHFTAHRFNIITRRTRFDLKKAEKRKHIVEGLIKAVDNVDRVVKIIRGSSTVEEAKKNLMDEFSFSEVQAQAILDMRLARLVALEIKKLQQELAELLKFIEYCKDLLANDYKIYNLIKEQLNEIANRYGDDRRTKIIKGNLESLNEEDYIERTNMVISLTNGGHIKRVPVSVYREQNRGGVGILGGSIKSSDDIMKLLFVADTHSNILFVTSKGKAYVIKAYQIPLATRNSKGQHVKILLGLDAGEKIEGYVIVKDLQDEKTLLIATRHGVVKRSKISDFKNVKSRGIIALKLKEGDTVIGITVVDSEKDDIMIFSRSGLAVRTNVSNIRIMGRTATGIRGMRLSSGDEAVGLVKVSNEENILVVSQKGLGKRLSYDEFSAKGRGGKGQIFMKLNDKSGEIAAVSSIAADESLLISTSKGKIIRLNSNDISTMGRQAKGPRLVRIEEPDIVIDIAKIKDIEEQKKEEEINSF